VVIQQVTYDIPPDIWVGLKSGEFSRFGSVVRNRKEIITHLKEVSLPGASQEGEMRRIAAGLKHPKAIAAIGLGTVILGGLVIFAARKRKQDPKPRMPNCVENYNASLGAYLEAVRSGNLDADIINRLISDLSTVKENSDSGNIAIDFSTEQSDTLVQIVVDYTRKLAEANSIELSDLPELAPDSEENVIIDLHRHLEVQKQIFDGAA
jgi:hypothetical protein